VAAWLALILLIGGMIAVALYFGLPYAYRQIVQPVRDTSARVSQLETQLDDNNSNLNNRIANLESLVGSLEAAGTDTGGRLATLQSQQAGADANIQSLSTSLRRLDMLESDLSNLQQQVSTGSGQIATLEMAVSGSAMSLPELEREVQALKAMNLLVRAQVYLSQSNFGLARDDVLAARAVLVALRDQQPLAERDLTDGWISRIDLALANLPAYPVVAAGDLQIAWQLMLQGMLPPTPTPAPITITPTPTPWISPTPYDTYTPTPTPWISPTPFDMTPTPTPFFTPSST
jgi:septal ring factor EnvC (AmiA/AmiB activator)